jgi:hypothetical protein
MFQIFRTGKPPLNLSALVIGGKPADSLSREELYRKLHAMAVPNINSNMGKMELLTRWGDHLAAAIDYGDGA